MLYRGLDRDGECTTCNNMSYDDNACKRVMLVVEVFLVTNVR